MEGFDGNGKKCVDIDECAKDESVNTLGSFSCTCGVGFDGNGKKCFHISKCNQRNICGLTKYATILRDHTNARVRMVRIT